MNYPECDPTTLKNSNANGFTLLVEKLNDTSVKQTLTIYNSTNANPRTFIRIKLANSTGNWNNWKEIEYKGHTHSTNDITGTITTNQIANTAITMDKINSNVYDTTNGGTSGSSKLITSDAVYNGLNSKSPTNHEHGKISSGGTLSQTTDSVKNVVVTDTTNNNIRVINKVPFDNLDGVAADDHTHSQYLTEHQDISGKQDISNLINSWSSTEQTSKYPSENLVKTSLNNKVDKVTNKGLSTNDFTNAYKTKIDTLNEEVNREIDTKFNTTQWEYLTNNTNNDDDIDLIDWDVTDATGAYIHSWFNPIIKMAICRFHYPFYAITSATRYSWNIKIKDKYKPHVALHGSAVTVRGTDYGIGTI